SIDVARSSPILDAGDLRHPRLEEVAELLKRGLRLREGDLPFDERHVRAVRRNQVADVLLRENDLAHVLQAGERSTPDGRCGDSRSGRHLTAKLDFAQSSVCHGSFSLPSAAPRSILSSAAGRSIFTFAVVGFS